jgi:Amt family ammonium transporter
MLKYTRNINLSYYQHHEECYPNSRNLVYCVLGFVYPPITHWAWTDEGWLNKLGYVDFAGSGPIHLLGGVCSFCAALFLGPRLGRFGAENEQIVGHSVPVCPSLRILV